MGKIDLGNFGQSTVEVAPQPHTSVIGEAVQGFGNQVGQIGRQMAEQRFQQQAVTASNNLLDHQLNNQKIVQDIQDKLASGDLQPEQAQQEYLKQSNQNALPSVDHLSLDAASTYNLGAKRVQAEGGFRIDALADVARKQRAIDQANQGIDTSLKIAGNPNVTPDQKGAIINQIKGFGPVLRQAGVPQDQTDQRVQNAVDQLWLDDATQRAIVNHDNMAGLKQVQKDLTDGFYAQGDTPKLDTNKRNAVLSQVTNRMDVLENRLIHEGDKREADGLRAVNEIQTQNASGVPATPDQWASWAQRTDGTSSSSDFADEIKNSQEIQDTLRKPIPDQIAFVQQKQAVIDRGGGSVKEQAHLFHLGQAIQKNATQMEQAPLIWMQNRIGKDVPPLDISTLLSPDGMVPLQAQINQRELDLQTMQKQYGPQIKMRPLLPQEAQQLSSIVSSTTPDRAVGVFKGLRQIAGNDEAYAGMMTQIAPDHPVLALAGLRALQDPQVATYIVQGESLLNPSKDQKGADGKPSSSLYLPEDKIFQQAFADAVGTTFRNHDVAAETAYQAVKAYYAGKAKHDGKLLEQANAPDSKLLTEAVNSVVGTIVDYNGKGEVSAPWGMDKSSFNKLADNAWAVAYKKYGLGDMSSAQRSQLGLTNSNVEGQYLVPSGNGYLSVMRGKQVVPVIIDVKDPAAINYVSPDRTFTDPRSGYKVSIN